MNALPIQAPPLALAMLGAPAGPIAADAARREAVPTGDASNLRQRLEFARGAGFRGVQLDASERGLRPRELSRSARRDLASLLRRSELSLSGVDLWIPPLHFGDPSRAARAIDAACEAVEFAAEMAGLVPGGAGPTLSMELPRANENGPGAVSAVAPIVERADACGVRLADHTWPPAESTTGAGGRDVGLDPAAIILAGASPAREASRLRGLIAAARLSDMGSAGRVEPGTGRLDELGYLVGLSTSDYRGMLVVDLRGVANAPGAARRIVERLGTAREG